MYVLRCCYENWNTNFLVTHTSKIWGGGKKCQKFGAISALDFNPE